MATTGDDAAMLHELDEMKRRLKEIEEEAAALRQMQAKVAKEMQGGDPNATTSEAKGFVGNELKMWKHLGSWIGSTMPQL